MEEEKIEDSEIVVRVLSVTDIKKDGSIKPSAFKLRNTENVPFEEYISVFREAVDTFNDDYEKFTTTRKSASVKCRILTEDLRAVKFSITLGLVTFDVKADPTAYKSHAGIFIAIDGRNICGDEIKKIKDIPDGEPVPPEVMQIRGRLAKVAQASMAKNG